MPRGWRVKGRAWGLPQESGPPFPDAVERLPELGGAGDDLTSEGEEGSPGLRDLRSAIPGLG
jgi:hypothetical protein